MCVATTSLTEPAPQPWGVGGDEFEKFWALSWRTMGDGPVETEPTGTGEQALKAHLKGCGGSASLALSAWFLLEEGGPHLWVEESSRKGGSLSRYPPSLLTEEPKGHFLGFPTAVPRYFFSRVSRDGGSPHHELEEEPGMLQDQLTNRTAAHHPLQSQLLMQQL